MEILASLKAGSDRLIDAVQTNKWLFTGKGHLEFNGGRFSPYGIHIKDGFLACSNLPDNIGAADDFTISCWIKLIQSKTDLLGCDCDSWYALGIFACNSSTLSIAPIGYPLNYGIESNQVIPLNEWAHCAVTREKGTLYLFYNGHLLGSTLYNYHVIDDHLIATDINSRQTTDAIYDDITIIKGKALWTKDFTAPARYLFGAPKQIYIDQSNSAWSYN